MDLAPFSNPPPLVIWRHNPPRQFVPPPRSWTNLNPQPLALFSAKQRGRDPFSMVIQKLRPRLNYLGGRRGSRGSVDKAVKLINAVLMKCYRWSSLHKPWSLEGIRQRGERERRRKREEGFEGLLLIEIKWKRMGVSLISIVDRNQ